MQKKIEIDELRRLVLKKLQSKFKPEFAEKIAAVMLFGELSGRTSHGLIRLLPKRFGPLEENPTAEPRLEKLSPLSARIHGNGNPGMLVATLGMEATIDIAKEQGVAVVTTNGTRSTSGSFTYFMQKFANADLIAFMMCNCVPLVAPVGALEKVLGTNPLAIAIPATDKPFIVDFGTSAVSYGEVVVAQNQGKKIPPDVAIDAQGAMTTDPKEALQGGLLAFGGHKGFGLALAIEILTSALAGATYCNQEVERGWGHMFIAIRPDILGDADLLKKDVHALVERVRHAKTKNDQPIRMPGETTLQKFAASMARGTIEVDTTLLETLES